MNNQKGKVKVSIGKAFKTIIWPKRNLVFIGLILIVLSRLSSLVLPWKSKQLLDEVIPNKDYQQLYKLLIIVGNAMLIQAITSFLLTKILSIQAQYLISELRAQVQKKVLSLPIHFFDDTKSGALVSRIMSDVEGVRNLIGTGLVQLLGGTITAVVAMILLIRISLSMTFFVLIPVTIFGIVALKAFKYIRPIFRKRGVINAQVKGRLTETLAGVRVIKAFNAETQEHQSFEKGVYLLFENVKKSLTATAFMTSASTFLLGIASTGIMGIGGYKIMEGELSIGDFLSFTLLLGFMIAPIVQMSNIGSQLTEALAGLDRTEELMNMQGEEEDVKRTISLETVKGNLVFDKVSFAYEEGKNVLEDISFIVPEGSVTALVGSSGSGKSTIAGLVATFLNPTRGLITIGGKDLSKVRLNSYRKHLGVVLQDEFLFEGTIRENVLFARPNATEEELQSAVSAAYVDEFTDRFENGLDTLIGERGVKLSGGQRQRLAIARAILADPEIIILDEATSSLDTESEALIQKSLSKLIKNRTTIVIAHRLSTIKQADQILVIESGSIVERGTHKKLIEVAGRYHDLYTYQAKI
ncbi:ABC transporter ATP-binding protein [Tenacibaculum maritimum]|uniref:ABC transporter ATP-binding protein n=1 Tax=Tenacibaculum maritimum TaxID=107401 RepID=UPI001E423F2D|nr:ABC transporter ATP-binding protein [Tenacibaculum maritimum]MCD9584537.1 ABC transporter ATP-binding protein/permease [Tenacibaculum maritimum]MCD9620960.1 ABC transporter ATP-binding protein/permease [Tenacibaculum maritimum]MCD9627188.1 ABC transporter ATP-binding protein/permease [Tenacibaculum maritimum]MCD9629758.1 ABC transporter ATP-binding protein/permease [Tenacibaculum maritimum]MCD9632803.1 ABC transporter ATP-binding protein/permease [Tenacibaculum maritimum]